MLHSWFSTGNLLFCSDCYGCLGRSLEGGGGCFIASMFLSRLGSFTKALVVGYFSIFVRIKRNVQILLFGLLVYR